MPMHQTTEAERKYMTFEDLLDRPFVADTRSEFEKLLDGPPIPVKSELDKLLELDVPANETTLERLKRQNREREARSPRLSNDAQELLRMQLAEKEFNRAMKALDLFVRAGGTVRVRKIPCPLCHDPECFLAKFVIEKSE